MDIDVQDTGSAIDASTHASNADHSVRRRLIGAGVLGLAGSLLPQFARRVGATSDTAGDMTGDLTGATSDTTGDMTGDTTGVSTGDRSGDTTPGGDAGDPANGGADAPGDTTLDSVTPVDTTPAAATTTTAPPKRPTTSDTDLLSFAQTVELAAVQLYDLALAGESLADNRSLIVTLREAHLAYSHVIGALIGKVAPGVALESAVDSFRAGFGGSLSDVLAAAYDLEATALATHDDLIGTLVGTDGVTLIASILMAEARHCTVLADLAGSTDLDTLLLSNATALAPTKG